MADLDNIALVRPLAGAPEDHLRLPWTADFAWEKGAVISLKTGIRIPITLAVLNEVVSWAIYLAILYLVSSITRLRNGERKRLWFAPDCPRPWYLIRGAAMWAGIDVARHPQSADAAFYFDDSTSAEPPASVCAVHLNARCTDIRKSYVASVFEEVFGYPLTVDPANTRGEIIEKPEQNGVHGGRVVCAPVAPRCGFTYQRLVDTRDEDGCCRDLRTPCADGIPTFVWVKVKTPDGRFSINNRRAYLMDADEIYSGEELARIGVFCERIGLDWGGLDILRDQTDGRIYIVDVNKTDLGPVIALTWKDKILSMRRLARALHGLLCSRSI